MFDVIAIQCSIPTISYYVGHSKPFHFSAMHQSKLSSLIIDSPSIFILIPSKRGTLVLLSRFQREGWGVAAWMQNLLCQNTIINSKLEQPSPMNYVLPQVPPNAFLRVTVNHTQRKVYFKDVRMCRKITRRPTPPLPDYNSHSMLGAKLDFNTDEDNQEESCWVPEGPQQ